MAACTIPSIAIGQGNTELLHASEQPSLLQMRIGEWSRQRFRISTEMRPIWQLPDVHIHLNI